jgi:DNA-binding LacI/PurR family transcriptional regulator
MLNKGDEMERCKRISSKDVAREAGVSQATVSYVLNNVEGVKIKPETREAVLEAAKRLNYHPNLIAKSMRLKKAMSIGVVSDKSISSYMFMNVLEGVRDALVSRNYTMTLCSNKSEDINNAEYIRYYSSNRIDGIIFVFTKLSEEQINYLIENNIPYVVIHTNIRNEIPHTVNTNMDEAVYEAVKHLVDNYGNDLSYFGVNAGRMVNMRYVTYLKTLEELGLEFKEDKVLKFETNEEGSIETLEEYYQKTLTLPRAILCDSAYLALNVLKFAAQKGIKVPEQTAVIGIGTTNFTSFSFPSLSAIEAPLAEMGYTGCDMLFDILESKPVQDVVVLKWDYIQRGSS